MNYIARAKRGHILLVIRAWFTVRKQFGIYDAKK